MTKTNQDTFDKAFINVLYQLQTLGFCKNVMLVEKHLGIPKRTLYQVLKGLRGVPLLHRHNLLKFFTENYNVNPRVFTNINAPIFKDGQPPTLEETTEPYNTKSPAKNMLALGDVMELERLRKEVADKNETIKELRKELKYWRDLAQGLLPAPKGGGRAAKKTGQKTGQK